MDRRRFFRQGLRELLRPLSLAVEPVEKAARQLSALEQLGAAAPLPPAAEPHPATLPGPWQRPPGARPEAEFLSACSRCGECARVCPAQCIHIDTAGLNGNGAPFIDPEVMPCVLCTGLQCMQVCPTGALVPTPLELIDMGAARWREDTCLRSSGQNCTICVDHCPVGATALEFQDNKVHVHEDGCTGCGACHYQCPTAPKSIVVVPKSAR